MRRFLTLLLAIGLLSASCGGSASDSATADSDAAAGSEAVGDAAEGEQLYAGTCASCHGPDAMGLEGLGRKLVDNEFVAGNSDEEMVAFIKVGRPASDPANLVGVDMPPKGGNPSLDDQAIVDIVTYLRTLSG